MQPNISSVGFKPLPLLNASRFANQSFTNTGPPSQSMTTSQPSNQNRVQLTLFAVDFPAKTSASQASKQALRKAQGRVCFLNSCESFAWWDRSTSCWRTSQRSLLTDWTLYSERWPKQGLMLNGHVFRRQMWAPAIEGTGGGALPTPVAQTGQGGAKGVDGGSGARQMLATAGFPRSAGAPTLLPTPVAKDDGKSPEAHLAMKARMKGGPRNTITSLAVLARNGMEQPTALLTPTATDWKGRTNWQAAGRNGPQRLPDLIPTGAATYLNPSFVEEMMGFPVGWTVLKP